MKETDNIHYTLRPDAQAFDEIRITTVPRYKTSDLSGDEWRISARIQFFRKGEMVFEDWLTSMEGAVRNLAHIYAKAIDDGHAFFGGIEGLCDQEGCAEKATVFYKKKNEVCSRCGSKKALNRPDRIEVRKFCQEHSTRGDCGMDDADQNYELLEGVISKVPDKDVKPATVCNVTVDSPEQIVAAVQQVRKNIANKE